MKNQAFTLIELLVVVLIIGILASIALPRYEKAVQKSKATQLQVLVDKVAKASNVYYMQNGSWPTSFDELGVDIDLPTTGRLTSVCARDWGPRSVKTGDGFEISLNTGGVGQRYRIGAFFTTGKYKCTGFTYVLRNDRSEESEVDQRMLCAENFYGRDCGQNCNWGEFCEKVMGKHFLVYKSTVKFYE